MPPSRSLGRATRSQMRDCAMHISWENHRMAVHRVKSQILLCCRCGLSEPAVTVFGGDALCLQHFDLVRASGRGVAGLESRGA